MSLLTTVAMSSSVVFVLAAAALIGIILHMLRRSRRLPLRAEERMAAALSVYALVAMLLLTLGSLLRAYGDVEPFFWVEESSLVDVWVVARAAARLLAVGAFASWIRAVHIGLAAREIPRRSRQLPPRVA